MLQPLTQPSFHDHGAWQIARFAPLDDVGWWSMMRVFRLAGQQGARRVLWIWLLATGFAVATGIAVVEFDWSALPVSLGSHTFHITLYPPLVVGMLLFLWLGPQWAMVSTYLTTFVLGAYSGMAWLPNSIFALSDSILILVVWSGMAVLEIPPTIRRRSDWAHFLALTLAGCVASSVGALVWNHSHGLAFSAGLAVWEGWVVGAFLEILLVVVPVVLLVGRKPRQWLARTLVTVPQTRLDVRAGAFLLLGALALFGAIAALLVLLFLRSISGDDPTERAAALLARLPEMGLFTVLVFVSMLGIFTLFIIAFTRRTERERQAAHQDRLTGCRNRRAFALIVAREASRSARLGGPLALIFLDLDRFKAVNDDHGHLVGDRVLQFASHRIAEEIRSTDYLFRWGGEEFAVLLPHTGLAECEQLAERIRRTVADTDIPTGDGLPPIRTTVSLGVASISPPGTPEELLRRAIEACGRAKRAGRNRVEAHPEPGGTPS